LIFFLSAAAFAFGWNLLLALLGASSSLLAP
jgi:hypothetical protein